MKWVPIPIGAGRDFTWVECVADAGPFWVTKARWQDMLVKYHKWCRIMGYVLTHKRSGARLAWFPSVQDALVAADQCIELIGEEVLTSKALDSGRFKHEKGHALMLEIATRFGDPFTRR